MIASLSGARSPMSMSMRLLLFGAAVAIGGLSAFGWSIEVTDIPYAFLLQPFLASDFSIAGQGVAVVLGFMLGFAHIFKLCYLPAALSTLPLIQAARGRWHWIKIIATFTVGLVGVCALWGAVVGLPSAALAATIGSRRAMGLVMQPVFIVTGLLMLTVALGELGLIRRILPDVHLRAGDAHGVADSSAGSLYRQALLLGVSIGATFGIVCNRPLYLVLLVYVALVGGAVQGALALGAYGLGQASSVGLAGLALLPGSRSARLLRWLGEREEAFHIVQGLAFAAMGAISVAFFWVRWGAFLPPA